MNLTIYPTKYSVTFVGNNTNFNKSSFETMVFYIKKYQDFEI